MLITIIFMITILPWICFVIDAIIKKLNKWYTQQINLNFIIIKISKENEISIILKEDAEFEEKNKI